MSRLVLLLTATYFASFSLSLHRAHAHSQVNIYTVYNCQNTFWGPFLFIFYHPILQSRRWVLGTGSGTKERVGFFLSIDLSVRGNVPREEGAQLACLLGCGFLFPLLFWGNGNNLMNIGFNCLVWLLWVYVLCCLGSGRGVYPSDSRGARGARRGRRRGVVLLSWRSKVVCDGRARRCRARRWLLARRGLG